MIHKFFYGHTEEDDVELYAYAEFDSIDNKDHYRLMFRLPCNL